jgi:hypothetical protein
MAEVNISKDLYGRIAVSFPYDSSIITKIRAIESRRWHPVEKNWTFPNRNGVLEKIESLDLGVFVSQAHPVICSLRVCYNG